MFNVHISVCFGVNSQVFVYIPFAITLLKNSAFFTINFTKAKKKNQGQCLIQIQGIQLTGILQQQHVTLAHSSQKSIANRCE